MNRAQKRLRAERRKSFNSLPKRICRNCGQPGPHFVPPSLGERGFFICEPSTLQTEPRLEPPG